MTNVYADDEVTGLSIFSITSPIMVNGQFKGITILDINAEALASISKSDAEFSTMFSELIEERENSPLSGFFIFLSTALPKPGTLA